MNYTLLKLFIIRNDSKVFSFLVVVQCKPDEKAYAN